MFRNTWDPLEDSGQWRRKEGKSWCKRVSNLTLFQSYNRFYVSITIRTCLPSQKVLEWLGLSLERQRPWANVGRTCFLPHLASNDLAVRCCEGRTFENTKNVI